MENIIITGAGGFLGSFYTEELSKFYNVIALDYDKESLKKFRNKKNIITYNIDVRDEKQIDSFRKKLKKKKLDIYGLINNAAIDSIPSSKKKNKYPNTKSWDRELDVGLKGAFFMIKFFGEDMLKKKRGKIINIGSDLSVIAPNQKIYKKTYGKFIKPVTYSVIKHGLYGMTKYFASLFAESNVNVNMLSPGPIFNNQKESFVKELVNLIPMKRMGKKEDLISSLKFLLNKKSSYISGQNIIVDGGRTII